MRRTGSLWDGRPATVHSSLSFQRSYSEPHNSGLIPLETHNGQGHDVGFLSFPFVEELAMYVHNKLWATRFHPWRFVETQLTKPLSLLSSNLQPISQRDSTRQSDAREAGTRLILRILRFVRRKKC
jgi:hypothetical protein